MSAADVDPVHAVLNQSTALDNYDSFATDRALAEAVAREGAGWAAERLSESACRLTETRSLELAALANRHPPVLRTHDRHGRRIDVVDFHSAWHELLALSIERGIVALPWRDARPGGHVARAALLYLHAQTEAGTACPISMSYAAVPVLQRHAEALASIREVWLPKLTSAEYDSRFIPAAEKRGVLVGMGMTERQGGSDVRSNITRAVPLGARQSGQPYAITGHKWFMSAPMCDAFLVLARADRGISCFLVPRWLEGGRLNALRFQRLKDKLGNHSNASSEVELHEAEGYLLGEEGRGVATIIEMASYTRLDCVLATSGLQRRCLAVALHHAAQREAFGARLVDKPLMSNVLADLAIEAEAATALAVFLARCFDPSAAESDRALGRLLTPAAKLHVCKRGAQFAAEAVEVLGGNGYVEDSDLARIYREMPLLSIWEGSGNVMCLDIGRVLAREPAASEALEEQMRAVEGANPQYDRFVTGLRASLARPAERDGRRLAHGIALAVQGRLLISHAPAAVADAFCATRLSGEAGWGASFGTLPPGTDVQPILARAAVH